MIRSSLKNFWKSKKILLHGTKCKNLLIVHTFECIRLCKEIVDDLPITYEMGEEATEWVRSMLPYNVAGGKMNRGLATLSVRNTLAEAAGRRLSNKVCKIRFLSRFIVFLRSTLLVWLLCRSVAKLLRWAGVALIVAGILVVARAG